MATNQGVLRSKDNGETWTTVYPRDSYLSIIGDGARLWAGKHFDSRFLVAPESNDTNWTEFNSQRFAEGPFEMVIDPKRRILYSANIRAGVWALKLPD